MKVVRDRASGAKFHALSWESPEETRGWLTALRAAVDTLRATTRDRLRGKRKRVLSRAEARKQARVSEKAIERLLAAAEAGHPLPEPPEVTLPGEDNEGEEGEEPTSPREPWSERRPLPPGPKGRGDLTP